MRVDLLALRHLLIRFALTRRFQSRKRPVEVSFAPFGSPAPAETRRTRQELTHLAGLRCCLRQKTLWLPVARAGVVARLRSKTLFLSVQFDRRTKDLMAGALVPRPEAGLSLWSERRRD